MGDSSYGTLMTAYGGKGGRNGQGKGGVQCVTRGGVGWGEGVSEGCEIRHAAHQ